MSESIDPKIAAIEITPTFTASSAPTSESRVRDGYTPSTKNFYEDYWAAEEPPRSIFSPELSDLIARRLRSGTSLLDAGCGDGGRYGLWVANQVGSYLGVDISERGVAMARERGLEARVQRDLASLDLPDASFDVALCIEVFEHLLFPEEALRELWRVLRPTGVLIATVPNVAYWRYRLDLAVLGRWHPQGHPAGARYPWRDPHVRFFTMGAFKRFIFEGGFDIAESKGVNGSLFGDLPFVRRRFGTDRLSRPFRALQSLSPPLFGSTLAIAAIRNPVKK